MKFVFSRKEYKYHVPIYLLEECKQYFGEHMELDEYNLEHSAYEVRSLYYDSLFNTFYHQKISGDSDRKKVRLRTYGDDPSKFPLFLEIKNKQGDKIYKERTLINGRNLKDSSLPEFMPRDDVYEKYFYMKKMFNLRPTVFVSYNRLGYYVHDQGFKITLDYNIRSSKIFDVWQTLKNTKSVNDTIFVLEMKFNKAVPKFFTDFIQKHNLQRRPFSKYTESVDLWN